MTTLNGGFPVAYLVPSTITEQLGLHNGLAEQRPLSGPLLYLYHLSVISMIMSDYVNVTLLCGW